MNQYSRCHALPRLGLDPSSEEIKKSKGMEGEYGNGFLQKWRRAKESNSPSLIFVPGFLTEAQARRGEPNPLDQWRTNLRSATAEWNDHSIWVYVWPSNELRRRLRRLSKWLPFIGGTAATGVAGQSILRVSKVSSQLVYPSHSKTRKAASFVMGLPAVAFVAMLKGVWSAAKSRADICAEIIGREISSSETSTILIGHSLGGRMALKMASIPSQKENAISRVIAMAPAITADEIEWNVLTAYPERNIRVIHSRNDLILKLLFPVGEFKSKAIGVTGLPPAIPRNVECHDVSNLNGAGVGHLDYCRRLYDIFCAAGLVLGRDHSSSPRKRLVRVPSPLVEH